MDSFLPMGFQPGRARPGRHTRNIERHLHVQVGAIRFPVLRSWATGFAVDAESVPKLRGLVDVFDGAEHLYQGVIGGACVEEGERIYEVRRAAPIDYALFTEMDTDPAPRGWRAQKG